MNELPRSELPGRDSFHLLDLAAALIEHWARLALVVVAACVATFLMLTVRPVKFEGSAVLSVVVSPRSLPLGGGLASSLLGGAALSALGGLQPTPGLIVRLTQLQSVMLEVAGSTPSWARGRSVIELLEDEPAEEISNARALRRMRTLVTASADRESGLITLRVVHKDSALVRHIVGQTITAVSRVFVQASRAQATELRQALEVRVDSAGRQLSRAEDALQHFLSANRALAPYAALQAERQRLERAITIAQGIYTQVLSDREAAVGKELEETPAVVLVDPLPERLPAVPRRRGVGLVLATILALTVGGVAVVISELNLIRSDREAVVRLTKALQGLPLLGRIGRRAAPSG